jgi:hypothetical protein
MHVQSRQVYPALDYPVLAHIWPKVREIRQRSSNIRAGSLVQLLAKPVT